MLFSRYKKGKNYIYTLKQYKKREDFQTDTMILQLKIVTGGYPEKKISLIKSKETNQMSFTIVTVVKCSYC